MSKGSENFRRESSRGEQQAEFLANKVQKHLYENGKISETRIMYAGLEIFRQSIFKREISFSADMARFPNPFGEDVLRAIEAEIAAFARDDEEKDFLYGAAMETIARAASIIFQVDYQRKHRMEPA